MILPLSLLFLAAHALYRAQGFRSRTLRAGDRSVHLYERRGKGKAPAVLLVHGLGGNAYSFAPLLPALVKACRRVVLIELPGHGRSLLGKDQPATVLECAQVVAAALLELGEPAVLIGNSLGGALSLHLASSFPEQVLGVIGLSPAGAPLAGEARLNVLESFRGGTSEAAMSLNRKLYKRPPRATWLFARSFAKHFESPVIRTLLEPLQRRDDPGLPAEVLARIRQPVLILWGDSDGILPASSMAFFRAHLPAGEVELVDDCGHLPQIERRALVRARVLGFLGKLTAPPA